METNNNYRCSICGGEIKWDPQIQKLKCPYCGETFTLEDMGEEGKTEIHNENYERGQTASDLGYTQSTDDTGVNPEDLRVYKCKYCSAEIITDKTTAATTCVYCGNPVVIEEQLVNDFTPQWVIPFKIPKTEVKEKYLSFIKRRFTPKSFLTDEHIEKIKGVYVPFWMYDGFVEGRIKYSGERTSTHRRGDSRITDHKVYDIDRAGNISLKNIPADGSAKISNALMDSIEPYNYDDLEKFEMPYLAGFYAEKYDEDEDTCKQRIKPRIENTLRTKLKEDITGFTSTKIISEDINANISTGKYAMLPVYFLNTKYNGADYSFAMNGQTGQMAGNIPIDKKKVAITLLIIGAVSAMIVPAITLLTMFIF